MAQFQMPKTEAEKNPNVRFTLLKWVFLVLTGLTLFGLGLRHGTNSQGKLESSPSPK